MNMDTNNKILYSLIFLNIINIGLCSAQHVLEKEYAHMRANDTIVKQEVAYKYPGRSGTDVFWNFSKLQERKAPYRICYAGNDTLISANEHQTSYSYELTGGDSLLLRGYRNRTTYFNAVRCGTELHYPFHYQDSLESFYYGEGKYSDKLAFISQGRVNVKADAWGTMLLPGNDTLKNVIRVYLQKDICERISINDSILLKIHGDRSILSDEKIQSHLLNDTIMLRLKDYRWYAEGYRYPVFETVCCETFRLGIPIAYYTTAFYYPPEEHVYLENDPLNMQLQELLKDKSLSAGHSHFSPEDDEDNHIQTELSVYYNTYPNPVNENLSIEYYLSDIAPVYIRLFDLNGRLLVHKNLNMQRAGVHSETISMDIYSKGNYILQLVVSDKTYVEKIIKE